MRARRFQSGYTLIELMVAASIMAILAGLAVRSYRSSTLKSNRQNGVECLVEVQKRLEDYYTRNNQYPPSSSSSSTLSGVGYGSGNCPASEGSSTLYTVALVQPNSAVCSTNACYQLTATGVGRQAKDGTLLLSVDTRSTAGSGDVYHKQHITPSGTTLDGWVYQPGR